MDRFAFDLWRHAPAGNVALSPTSIRLAMAMTYAGARGRTAEQIRAAVELDGTGIAASDELFLAKAFHQAFVKVDEKGTEAAAATSVALAARSHRPPPTEIVKVDRPFLFWIVDEPTGAVLFAGRVVDPR